MKKVSVSLPEDLGHWMRIKAAKDDLSVSRWLAELLEGMRRRKVQLEAAMKRYLAIKPRKIDWPNDRRPTREELYDGSGLR